MLVLCVLQKCIIHHNIIYRYTSQPRSNSIIANITPKFQLRLPIISFSIYITRDMRNKMCKMTTGPGSMCFTMFAFSPFMLKYQVQMNAKPFITCCFWCTDIHFGILTYVAPIWSSVLRQPYIKQKGMKKDRRKNKRTNDRKEKSEKVCFSS